jgi:hypothetical protein
MSNIIPANPGFNVLNHGDIGTEEIRAVLVNEVECRIALQTAKARSYVATWHHDLRVTEINHRVALETEGLQRDWEMAAIEAQLVWVRAGILPPGWSAVPSGDERARDGDPSGCDRG